MKFKNKFDVSKEFEHLFDFKDKGEEELHEAKMIMFRFLSEIEKISEEKTKTKIKKKELAASLGTSASYITQLFNGEKLINLTTIAKLQEAFDVTFEITAKPNFQQTAYEPKIIPIKLNVRDEISNEISSVDLYTSTVNTPMVRYK